MAPPAPTAKTKVKAAPKARRVTKLVFWTVAQMQLITKKLQSYMLVASAGELERLAVKVPRRRRSPKEEDTSESSNEKEAVEETMRKKVLAAGTKKRIERYKNYRLEEVTVDLSAFVRTAVMRARDKTYLAAAGTMLRHLETRSIDVDVDADEAINRGIVDYMEKL